MVDIVSLLTPVISWADGAWLSGWHVLLGAWLGLFDGNIFWPALAGLLIAIGGLTLAGPTNVGFGFYS